MKHTTEVFLIHNDALRRQAWCVVLFLFAACAGQAQQRADVFIIERPEALSLFNQYQQQFTADERNALKPFTPFRILNENDVLGDGFTECIRAELAGRPVFILKEDGVMVGAGTAGRIQRLRDVRALHDTIEIVSSRLVVQNPQQQSQRNGKPGEVFVRVFRDGGKTYVRALGGSYGWLNLDAATEGQDWVVVKEIKASRGEQLRTALPRIQLRVQETNNKLELLFQHMLRQGRSSHEAPQWRVRETAVGIECVMDRTPQDFPETSQALAKNIETLLFGTSLRVSVSPGKIEIR